MLLLKKKTFELEATSPLVKSDEAAAINSAEEIIEAAKAEAQQIIAEAKDAYEAEKVRGYQDGIAEGKEEILLQKMDLLDETVTYMENVEGKIVDLVQKALKKCIAEIGDKELIVQIVRKSMQAIVRTQRQITIKVSPEMVPVVKGRVQEIMADFPNLAIINVMEDPHLTDTTCIIETEAGLVEASVEGQMNALQKSIENHFKH